MGGFFILILPFENLLRSFKGRDKIIFYAKEVEMNQQMKKVSWLLLGIAEIAIATSVLTVSIVLDEKCLIPFGILVGTKGLIYLWMGVAK